MFLDGPLGEHQAGTLKCMLGELLQVARDAYERATLEILWALLPRVDRPSLWLDAGRYARSHRLLDRGVWLIDTGLLVTARAPGADPWTLDRKLEALWKAATG